MTISIPETIGALGNQQAAEFTEKGMVFLFPLIWEHEFTESLGIHKIWKSVVFFLNIVVHFIQVNEPELLPVGIELSESLAGESHCPEHLLQREG